MRPVFLLVAMTLALTACMTSQTKPHSPSTAAQPAPSLAHSSPTTGCSGLISSSAVQDFVASSGTALFVSVTVSGGPTPVAGLTATSTYAVSDVRVLAGTAKNGRVAHVLDAELPGSNDLPPGRYLMLLSHANAGRSTYLLALGLPGSFVIKEGIAYERCPNFDDPSQPILATDGTAVSELIRNVARALAADS